jgi:hypothetical protein
VSFAAITLCVASQRMFIVVSVYFVIGSVRKRFSLSDTGGTNALEKHLHPVINHVSPWSRVLLEKLIVLIYPVSSSPFVEPEGSLPCSQELATGSCTEPDKSSPQFPNLLP